MKRAHRRRRNQRRRARRKAARLEDRLMSEFGNTMKALSGLLGETLVTAHELERTLRGEPRAEASP